MFSIWEVEIGEWHTSEASLVQMISSKPEWVTVRPVITKPEYADIGINI